MKRSIAVIAVASFLFILFPTVRVSAQQPTPIPLPSDAWKGTISGRVINKTAGKIVTEPVDMMLHVWDTQGQERGMQHGKSESNGSFHFDDVDFHQTFIVSVMTTYIGATYESDPVNIQKGDTAITINGSVYETTNDPAAVSIGQLHVLFYFENGELGVTQFYTLSNAGNLTVKDAVTLPRDRTGTVQFNLPDEAQNVSFGNDDSGTRYVLLAGSFVDTAPIPPGENISQVVVGYNLAFSGSLMYEYMSPVPIQNISFLVMENSGLTLQGKGLIPNGESTMQDGSKFLVYSASSLQAGQKIQLTLSGRAAGLAQGSVTSSPNSDRLGLVIGASALGVVLAGVGIWWWRRRLGDEEEIEEDTVEGVMAEIESLDLEHEGGEISNEEYQEHRSDLRNRLKAVMGIEQ